jgi:hypothetical protein
MLCQGLESPWLPRLLSWGVRPFSASEVLMSDAAIICFIDASQLKCPQILAIWNWLLQKPLRLLGISLFGDLFLEDKDGSIKMLDLVACELKQIAICIEEFEWGLGNAEQQENWLMVSLAKRLASNGIRTEPTQCLAFRTPPILGGPLNTSNVVVLDLMSYYQGLAKLLPQILHMPPGSEVNLR